MTATEKKERVIYEWLKSLPAHDFTQSFAEVAAAVAKANAAKKAVAGESSEGTAAATDGAVKDTGENRNKRPVRWCHCPPPTTTTHPYTHTHTLIHPHTHTPTHTYTGENRNTRPVRCQPPPSTHTHTQT